MGAAESSNLPRLLGVAPLLSALTSLVAGLTLGVAAILLLCAASALVAATRTLVPAQMRLAAILVLNATLATIMTVLFQAFFFDEFLALSIALPLLAINVVMLEQAQAFAVHGDVSAAVSQAIRVGISLVVLMAALGALRELIGHGTLLAGTDAFGEGLAVLTVHLRRGDAGFVLALTPAGGFLLLGLLIGARNALALRRAGPPAAA